ncbi:hypothetical protein [Synechococcus sp. CS-197]|uniref:hypothetical protein n=1 Tax=Synechococcus sp. CS-197 TaxID=2847985 RepID=UPI000152534B|nr:hypothetical protein [Synechococcus sp. CS-197]MCT0250526.1 hypothetical protein [Synechococcus sp. CS-197]CAK23305.1 Uncharacterized membrane protein [Synechococcus sp. WH 7803]
MSCHRHQWPPVSIASRGLVALGVGLGITLGGTSALAQMRGPRIGNVRDVTCVANWERRFQVISPGVWEMTMGVNDPDPFIFRETRRSTQSINLELIQNSRLQAILNLGRQRIKYIIPGMESDPLYFKIQSYNINGESC